MNAVARRWAQLSDGLPAPFWALLGGTLVNRAGAFVVPMLFVYLTQSRGLAIGVAGSIVSLYGLGSLCGTFIGGVMADRVGRRATMLVSLVVGAVFMVLLGFARETWQIASTAFLLGLSADAYRPASQALVADIVPPQHRMKAFGLQYWAINLGFSFAVTVAGFMAKRNFLLLFIGDAITTLALAAIVFHAVPESRPEPEPHARTQGSFLAPFVDAKFLPFLALNFLVVCVFFQHITALPEDMRSKGLTTENFGLAIATNGVLIVLLQPMITRWVAGTSRAVLLAIAAALTGIGMGATALASTLPMYMATVAIWSLGEIIFAPVNAALVAELSPTALRGRYQGAFHLTWSLGAMLAPGAGPWLIQATGLNAFWAICLGLGLFAAVMHLTLMTKVLGKTVAPHAQ